MVFALFACRLNNSGLFAYKCMLDRACLNKEWIPGHFGAFGWLTGKKGALYMLIWIFDVGTDSGY